MRRKSVGIYAGTFDPIHNGHLTFALAAARVCGLGTVLFLPERLPRNKQNVTDFAHRAAMIESVVSHYPNLGLHTLNSNQFTVQQTLPELQKLFANKRLTLLMGSDTALNMNQSTWPGVEAIYKSLDIAIGLREGHTKGQFSKLAGKARLSFIYTNQPQVAASKVRDGQLDWLHPTVLAYIKKHKLYSNTD